MREVAVSRRPIERFTEVMGDERADHVADDLRTQAHEMLGSRTVLNVNSTSAGGGVAEMLWVLLSYVLDAGLDARWVAMEGNPEFFELTKRIHNHLYGQPGDGGPLGPEEHQLYEKTLAPEAEALGGFLSTDDIALIHDPQPAGLAEAATQVGAIVVWRCHVGVDAQNEHSQRAWDFLRPYLEPHVDHYVFTRREFAPDWIPEDQLTAIPPSIDPFSPKNQDLEPEVIEAILTRAGLVDGRQGDTGFTRSDGSAGSVDRACDIVRRGPAPAPDVPIVTQVSRWDPMKDMAGVLRSFVEHVDADSPAHLVLAGPAVGEVADDPEAGRVLEQCVGVWEGLDPSDQRRVSLASLPMDDGDENAAIVNALQRHSAVVVQKSIAEGFGLTVVEALLKARPVVASAVGGIRDQITDGQTGLLLQDPTDLASFGELVTRVIDDPDLARRLGDAGRQHAIDHYLGDTHLERWLTVLGKLVAG